MAFKQQSYASLNRTNRASLRTGSVYVAVTGTAILISLIGLTSLHLSRLELRNVTSQNELAVARQLAYSSVEFALATIDLDPSWRTNYLHGLENVRNPTGITENHYFRFLDNADSNLADDATEPVEIQGIGRCGDATFVYSAIYTASVTSNDQVGPTALRSYDTSNGSVASFSVTLNSRVGQYFVPNLPAGATTWSITSVDLSVQQAGFTDETMFVKIHNADGSGMPTSLVESAAVAENSLANGAFGWHSVNFATVTNVSAGQGMCLTLEGSDSLQGACLIEYDSSGVAETNAHALWGNASSWTGNDATQSLLYRINGVYSTSSGNTGSFTISPGSWQSVAAP